MLPPKGRDLRLDLFRGLANWVIFIAHIPNNVVAFFVLGTGRYGFSDGADMFVFISGYTLAFVYARMLVERGMVITATRIIKRAWQIYVAHVFLLVVYLVEIGYFGQKFGEAEHAASFNVKIFLDRPAEVLYEGLILKFKPVNMDVLPLFIVLMLASPLMLWGLLRFETSPCLPRSFFILRRGNSAGIFPRIRTETCGTSIHSPGSCCTCPAPGWQWAERWQSCRSSARERFCSLA